jgi:hypothetical protein
MPPPSRDTAEHQTTGAPPISTPARETPSQITEATNPGTLCVHVLGHESSKCLCVCGSISCVTGEAWYSRARGAEGTVLQ